MLYSASYILTSLFAFYNFIDNPKLRKKTYICIKHIKYLTPDSTALEGELASCLLLFCFDVSDIHCPIFSRLHLPLRHHTPNTVEDLLTAVQQLSRSPFGLLQTVQMSFQFRLFNWFLSNDWFFNNNCLFFNNWFSGNWFCNSWFSSDWLSSNWFSGNWFSGNWFSGN